MEQIVLKQILKERNITPYRLAKDCKIALPDIYQALNGKKQMFPRWKKSIATYLQMSEEVLFGKEKDYA